MNQSLYRRPFFQIKVYKVPEGNQPIIFKDIKFQQGAFPKLNRPGCNKVGTFKEILQF